MEVLYDDFTKINNLSSYKMALLGLYYVNKEKMDKAESILKELIKR